MNITFRKPVKLDTLFSLFEEEGSKMKVQDVLDISGVKNYNSLKALFSYIRKSPSVPEENRIDVRIQDNMCIRIG